MNVLRYLLLLVALVSGSVCWGQSIHTYISKRPQQTDAYYQTMTYYGEKNDLIVVSTFLTDSSLYRVDTYRIAGPDYAQSMPSEDRLAVWRAGATKVMYPNGQVYLSCLYRFGRLDGPLLLYYNDGLPKRRELYKEGQLKKSHCYTQQGIEQPCSPLYQPVQFAGSYKDLQRYLEKSMEPIFDRTGATDVLVKLTINELGQPTNTTVQSSSRPNDDDLITSVRAVMQNIQLQVPNQLNWKSAMMDDVPVTDVQRIYITKRKGFVYVSIPVTVPN